MLLCPADGVGSQTVLTDWMGAYCSTINYAPSECIDVMAVFVPSVDEGVMPPNSPGIPILSISDGTSSTLLFGEFDMSDPNFTPIAQAVLGGPYSPFDNERFSGMWSLSAPNRGTTLGINYRLPAAPYPSNPAVMYDLMTKRTVGFSNRHTGGANFAFADGSVRFVRGSLSPDTLKALCTRAGGEVIAEVY